MGVTEGVEKQQVNKIRKRNKTDTLTSVDIQEIVKFEGLVFEINEAVIYRKNFEYPLFRRFGKKFFLLREVFTEKGI